MTFWPWRRRGPVHQPLFQLGQLVVSAPARAALRRSNVALGDLLARHQRGDWGLVDEVDAKQNELGLRLPMRIRSIYWLPMPGDPTLHLSDPTSHGDEIRLITSADRTRTQVILPREIFDAKDQEPS